MEEHKWPILWCGGKLTDQDVTIRLVSIDSFRVQRIPHYLTTNTSHQTLGELKVHSSCLIKCSKYFETCFNERWANHSSKSSLECELEVQGELACYEDCFSRMYTPLLLKNFKDVTYSLQLLRVASQIQFQELMNSIFRYLSAIPWSAEDESMIREYTSSQDFPQNQAKDLVTRLDLDLSNDECRKQACKAIEQFVRDDFCFKNFISFPGNFYKELLLDSPSSTFVEDVVMILNKEAKDVILKLHEECVGNKFEDVPELQLKVTRIYQVMVELLRAGIAEEVVEYFLQFELYPKIFNHTIYLNGGSLFQLSLYNHRKFILHILQEVIVGNLLLGISGRVALLQKWSNVSFMRSISRDFKIDYKKIVRDLFLTLPFKAQMELIKLENHDYKIYIDSKTFTALLKSRWLIEADLMMDDS